MYVFCNRFVCTYTCAYICVYVFVYVYMYFYIYIYINIFTYIYVYSYSNIYLYLFLYLYLYLYPHLYLYLYLYLILHLHLHLHLHLYLYLYLSIHPSIILLAPSMAPNVPQRLTPLGFYHSLWPPKFMPISRLYKESVCKTPCPPSVFRETLSVNCYALEDFKRILFCNMLCPSGFVQGSCL